MKNGCFIDTNVLVYLFDASSAFRVQAQGLLKNLTEEGVPLYISHQILEEFIFIQLKLAGKSKEKDRYKKLLENIENISDILKAQIIEPSADFSSAKNVIKLLQEYTIDPNDAYILSIILEHRVESLMTFDKKLRGVAKKLRIKVIA